MKVVGEAVVFDVLESTPDEIWEMTCDTAGIDREFFDSYYSGRDRAIAFRIGQAVRFEEPKELSDYGLSWAPQSFAYLSG